MSVRPALVGCVVLSLQDTCVFYPCCRECFSRIQPEHQDPTRWRCPKCGYICLRENVDHRYRLSLKVTRNKCIFGVTVFGTCLNPFFGIHATGLQRLVENTDGPVEPTTRSTLLARAVQDCFIGRHVIFGIKVTETEPEPWLRRGDGSSSSNAAQLIANQMILPKALSLGGCTVVSYYQGLLQKAAEFELGSTDPSLRPPEAPLLLLPCYSPASSFNHAYHCTLDLQNQSLQRSQSLSPTPPWQQSLGLVTSSAEQEESLSTQDSRVEDGRKNKNKTPNHTQKDNKGYHKEERRVSPLPPVQRSTFSSPSFSVYSYSPIDKAVENTSFLDTSSTPSSHDHSSSKKKRFSTSRLTDTIWSDSLAWEDLPFSESLTEFLGEEKKNVFIGTESEPNLKVQNQEETTRNKLEVGSQSVDLSVESPVCQYKQTTDSRSQIVLDIVDTPVSNRADRHDISDQICETPVVPKRQARTLLSQEDETAHSPFFEKEEEQIDGDVYDCSAELFSSSPLTSMNKTPLTTYTESVGTSTEAPSLLSVPEKQLMRRGCLNMPHLTPHKQQLKTNKCVIEDDLIPPGSEEHDFIPPSQSTPIVKVGAVTGSAALKKTSTFGVLQTLTPDSNSRYKDLPELDDKKKTQIPHSCGRKSTKENLLWSSTTSRHRFISKRRFWKRKKPLLPQAPSRVQRVDLSSGSSERLNRTFHSSCDDGTVCGHEDQYPLFVPPTPAEKSLRSVKIPGRTNQTLDSSSNLVWTCGEQQGDGTGCETSVLDQSGMSSQRGVAQRRHCETSEKETYLSVSWLIRRRLVSVPTPKRAMESLTLDASSPYKHLSFRVTPSSQYEKRVIVFHMGQCA
ncbi:uncharacterized protein ddias [Xyrichtys novacula]|uniref:Uncharacterized protein ddias n=1 Tax=Xyrichtys novacula TaxID=13765 RepID=A0AAV1EK03_XYRNO|nr:uncharacterized protein ddias [Xyrichtys novacula]